MLLEHIRFENRQALKLEISDTAKVDQALKMLGFEKKQPVIVIVGGAGGIRDEDWEPIRKAMNTIVDVANENGAAIIDGGTESGVMAISGQLRAEKGCRFPLIGIAAEGTVKWPERKLGFKERMALNKWAAPLDSNHTHFILTPGNDWGDESPWIADIATQLSGGGKSVAVLINGGNISRDMDVPNNMKAGRTVLVIEGTGRAADEFATHPPDTPLMRFIHISELDRLATELKEHLQSTS